MASKNLQVVHVVEADEPGVILVQFDRAIKESEAAEFKKRIAAVTNAEIPKASVFEGKFIKLTIPALRKYKGGWSTLVNDILGVAASL